MPNKLPIADIHQPQAFNASSVGVTVGPDPRDGNDALCFTPGFAGASFGAGAIHAYLAADRDPPRVVAGISLGTVSAAVMQRAYRDLIETRRQVNDDLIAAKNKLINVKAKLPVGSAEIGRLELDVERIEATVEAARWKFFRKYLSFLTDRPFDVIWKGIPDPADFFAELPPIKDPVPETIGEPENQSREKKDEPSQSEIRARWKKDELQARKELYSMVKLGHWLAKMPLRISAVANITVSYVRLKERYPTLWLLRAFHYLLWLCAITISLVLHIVRVPARFPDYKFKEWREDPEYPAILSFLRGTIGWIIKRPLFGWGIFMLCASSLGLAFASLASAARFCLVHMAHNSPWLRNIYPIPANWFWIFCNFLGATSFLFLATSLGTWWVPMKGRFPFRVIPLACSITAVFLLGDVLYAPHFSGWSFGRPGMWERLAQKSGELNTVWSQANNYMWPVAAILILSVIILSALPNTLDWLAKYFLKQVAMEKHIVHDYYLNDALTSLFGQDNESPRLTYNPFPIVLAATPLQEVDTDPALNNQLWATAAQNLAPKIVDVLRATLAIPGVLDPYTAKGPDSEYKKRSGKEWYTNAEELTRLDLVDGSVIRHNPLPALFSFIRKNYLDKKGQGKASASIATALASDSPSNAKIHVVYNVPVQAGSADGSKGSLDNIIDVAFLSLRLAKRRDINMEIDQTNFIAGLAYQTQEILETSPVRSRLEEQVPSDPIFPIFADHIAPADDLSFANPLAPKKNEILKHAAAGCKTTLEQLYSDQIMTNGGRVACEAFLVALRRSKNQNVRNPSGLPEICSHCSRFLEARRDSGKKAVFGRAEKEGWEDRDDLTSEFPQLTSEEPRIVFVASGGVFRGPFHAGMINAMLAVKMKPDLIVGASVGTLVGGALAATLGAQDHNDSLRVLEAVVKTFQQMDERIAFTKTLKGAVRELGIRSRMVDLAPYELRKKILEGTKSDPGFAVTGTPPILIDAISDILLIPHGDTAKIAAQFVAGHFTNAIRRLIKGLRTETLRRLDITEAVMGASLLEPTARKLLGAMLKNEDGSPWYDMNSRQPYKKARIAIFGTSTDLLHRQPVLLGRYKWQLPSYDFVNACLASSAFPAVFAPRKDEQIFPGLGDPQLLYSDGGMFDNLPISPALEILSASQKKWIRNNDAVRALEGRINSPDLFIAGSLEVNARSQSASASMQESKTDNKEFDTLVAIKKRVSALQKNLKIRAFEQVSEKISVHLRFLWQIVQATSEANTLGTPKPILGDGVNLEGSPRKNTKISNDEYLNGLVNAVLLPVYPTDSDHLNGTFQFCNSLGKNKKVVNQSMADGCFQTLRELTIAFSNKAKPTRARAVDGLSHRKHDPLPVLAHRPEKLSRDRPQDDHGYYCPFFVKRIDDEDIQFACPFSQTETAFVLFQSCSKDKKHRKIYKIELLSLQGRRRPSGEPTLMGSRPADS